jgi:HSP20 family protein
MNAIIRSPSRLAWDSFHDFDGIFNGVLRPLRAVAQTEGVIAPVVDINESDVAYEVKAELPGVNKDELEVSVKDGTLTISAEVRDAKEDKVDGRVIRQERRFGKYIRTLRLGENIDETAIKGEYKDGILRLVLPKAEAVTPKKIEVEIH